MPIGKIGGYAGKGGDYSSGSQNIDASKKTAATTVSGYQKADVQHSYGAGALNVEAQTNVPKVKENLSYSKAEGSGTSQYGAGAVGMETAMKAPKLKHEGLGQVDKTKEMVRE